MAMRFWAAAAATSLIINGVSARAAVSDLEFYTGADLYAQCSAAAGEADRSARQARCEGYVTGVSDALQAQQGAGRAALVCIPAGVAQPQVVASVKQYLDAHAEKRQIAAQDLVLEALSAAYPCK